MKKKINIILDYRDTFYHSSKHPFKDGSMNLHRLIEEFKSFSWEIDVIHYPEIDIRNRNYKDCFILYQSSEDKKGFYRNYIEDILLGLSLQGAKLIPEFKYFRAHDNKVFMEIIRDLLNIPEIQSIKSKNFGTIEEFEKYGVIKNTMVMKTSDTCASKGVSLIDERSKRKATSISKTPDYKYKIYNFIKKLVYPTYIPTSQHRNKFILQNLIPQLNGDFKVLVYFDKIFIVSRFVKKNDFRASGSGLSEFGALNIPKGLLDYAYLIRKNFNVPYVSLDIAYDKKDFHLIEFQFLNFGNIALEASQRYWQKYNNNWKVIEQNTTAEHELARSIDLFYF